jgi:hypothetical protein
MKILLLVKTVKFVVVAIRLDVAINLKVVKSVRKSKTSVLLTVR